MIKIARKLATIREIRRIYPIEGADKIEVALIDGWEVVVPKNEGYKVGDLVVYVEIDSKMPETPEYEFLKSRKYIVKTVKIRGQISQGLVLPLSVLPEGTPCDEGRDVTKLLGIEKYDPEEETEKIAKSEEMEIIERLSKGKRVIKFFLKFGWFKKRYIKNKSVMLEFPNWIDTTNEERIQNKVELFQKLKEKQIPLQVTEKMDGTSATYYVRKAKGGTYEFGVCSHRRKLPIPDKSHFWKVAKDGKIQEALLDLVKRIGNDEYVILQGEITGEGIQKNKYGEKGLSFWAFNLIVPPKNPGDKKYRYDTNSMQDLLIQYGIHSVPMVTLDYKVPEDAEISDIVEFVKGKSQVCNRQREGCVFRNNEMGISFKVINPDFLLKNNE